MNTTKTTSIQIRQNGQILKAFKGCRLHRGGTTTGIVGNVVCFADAFVGDRHDPRRGKTITPDTFKGPVTIEILNTAGEVVTRFGLATATDVANHPNAATANASR